MLIAAKEWLLKTRHVEGHWLYNDKKANKEDKQCNTNKVKKNRLKTEDILNTVFTQVRARGAHLTLSSQRGGLFEGGALSREALIEYIKKTSKYFQLVS